ncbi:MAG: hypothetical protein V3U79_06600 [Dehalococcoidia bacterium]
MKKLLFLLPLMIGGVVIVRRFIPGEVRKALKERAMQGMMGHMPENCP